MQSWNKVSGSGISQVRNEWVGLVMAQYWVSQVVSSLVVDIIGILIEFGIENYGLKVVII